MIEWIKPNGVKITTNGGEANIKAAESLGWVRADSKKPAPKKPTTEKKKKG